MNNIPTETIAALATPPGRGGIGVIRVSGSLAREAAKQILGHIPKPRYAEYLPFKSGDEEIVDEGIALFFPSPNSFTGEDVLELQGHGGPVVMDRLLSIILETEGVRAATPGEFSERAFLNGKMDLAQAEAIADLIEASSVEAAKSALRSLHGEFSEKIDALVKSLTELRIYVESAIDFPEEEIDFLADGEVQQRLSDVTNRLQRVQQSAQQGNILREGMNLVLAGQPNCGKSSLLNALAGEESAIVTDIAGTTRDLLKQEINIDGMPLHIIDTAGLRVSHDPVEQEGIRRAWRAIEGADRVLLLIDDRVGLAEEDEQILEQLPEGMGVTVVHNKIDLTHSTASIDESGNRARIFLSAKQGIGIDLLRSHIKQSMGYRGHGEGSFMARRRHLDAINRAQHNLNMGQQLLDQGSGELVAEELRLAQIALGEITGEVSSDELLGKIFSSFCIGK
ncbi:MAG TPA: tRNA uridine-5-carboxymethylaminomethyl(34) synthesis GTPase MnmE [Ectothiorhodospiraceae bacterium]|nr:tRNA uridine-5-carboxymethylaminomethyl(34) synthesis GTPase MnmE [Ectothiorhodospiraceae bacterium]